MSVRFAKLGLRLLPLVGAFVLALVLVAVLINLNWLSPFGVRHESRDSQVVRTIDRLQEVALLSLGIQGIKDDKKERTVFGWGLPGTSDSSYLQYEFTAKVGIDGALVRVTKTATDAYTVSVPEFKFIGYSEPTFKLVVEDGGLLKFLTPDIDKIEMVNAILSESEQERYVSSYAELLQQQAEFFYSNLLHSVDPEIDLTFEFA